VVEAPRQPPTTIGPTPAFDLVAMVAKATGAPGPELDRYLDAASRCFARFGLFRTSVQDVARELGVNRATVYRQVGNVDEMVRLVAARDLTRALADFPWKPGQPIDAEMVVSSIEYFVTTGRAHPVLAKLLEDEPEAVNVRVIGELPTLLRRATTVVAPVLASGMATGGLPRRDPKVLAEWLIRTAITLILVPAPGDLRRFLAEVLVPALAPGT